MAAPDIHFDNTKCFGCGACINVCPDSTLSLVADTATVTGEKCMVCGHCMAACPVDAIVVAGIDPEASRFHTFQPSETWQPPGVFDISSLVDLMRSRRSVRNYADKPVSLETLNDLAKIGATAPSGTNSQKWTFTLLPDRETVLELGNMVALFYDKLNRQAANTIVRKTLQLFGKPDLLNYYKRYFKTVAGALEDWQQKKIDRLFHGAPAAILVGSQPGASCPAEDALLATQNILLAAHSMGLGTCLIGYVVEAIKRDRKIKSFLNIPADEKTHAVIAVGYGLENYRFVTGRKKLLTRVFKYP